MFQNFSTSKVLNLEKVHVVLVDKVIDIHTNLWINGLHKLNFKL